MDYYFRCLKIKKELFSEKLTTALILASLTFLPLQSGIASPDSRPAHGKQQRPEIAEQVKPAGRRGHGSLDIALRSARRK